ncbi:UNVERIFIED_ORG: hypothetical protein QFZ59_004128 [Bacillus sp. B2I3]|nr:hypothetical protein [Bacillus sp. B2I3]
MSKSIHELVAETKTKRIERTRRIPVFRLVGEVTELLPRGSGVLILAEQSSDIFDQLQQALATNDVNTINKITTEIKPIIGRLNKVDIKSALKALQASEAIADLYYGPKQVVYNAFTVAGVGFTRVLFTFVGGDFDSSDFRLVEYAISEKAENLQALAVVHEPAITAREREVLRNLPEEARGMVFGPMDPQVGTPAAAAATITVALIVAAAGTALTRCHWAYKEIERVKLPDQLNSDPSLAAMQLLEVRREALRRDR